MDPTIEPVKPPSVLEELGAKMPTFQDGDSGVMLKWKPGRVHEIYVVGMSKPSQLRQLLEFGLRHIRACLYRGRPITSEAQVSSQKRESE
jgi:hypothetical protein